MIMPRLVLGTARIAGCADQQYGVALIRSALDLGLTHIDTAPSYGMGTAESVVGQALAGHDQVGVTAKLGSARPAHPWLRTAARRLKRAICSAGTPAVQFPPEHIEGPCGNDFSPAAMARSFAVSRERMGRIDVLLLHDISADEVSSEVLGRLTALAATAQAAPGYAGYARWDAALDREFPAAMIAQCAPDPQWLDGTRSPPTGRALWLHSVAKTGLALAASQPHFAAALDQAAALVDARDAPTARLAALYALAAERVRGAQLLVTSSRRDRLESLLAAITVIDRSSKTSEIVALFGGQAG